MWRLTAIEVAFSLGMMLGGLIIASWGGFKIGFTPYLIHSGNRVTTLCPGHHSIFWIYLAFMGLAGIAMPIFNTPFTVLLQEKVEADYLGRIFGF